jgi:hypothetical protein
MFTLEQMLEKRIAELGPDHKAVQMLRNQIAADGKGQTLQEVYLTGSVKAPEKTPA